jgi:acyl-CoA thioesterase YciA
MTAAKDPHPSKTARHTSERTGDAIIRAVAMPKDTNPFGDIFGGWIMAQMDSAAGSVAIRRAQGRCVTVAVDGMSFLQPVFVGDEVSIYAELVAVGRTSMSIHVAAWRRSRAEEIEHKVTEATFKFVAIDEGRRPRVIMRPGDL